MIWTFKKLSKEPVVGNFNYQYYENSKLLAMEVKAVCFQ